MIKRLNLTNQPLIFVGFLLLFLLGCDCCNKAVKAVEEACKDSTITSEERSEIAKLLRSQNDRKYRVDEAVDKFISEHCSNVPTVNTVDTAVTNKPIYKVFIENSASMDGYVQGSSDFKNAIYGFLSDIRNKLNGITNEMNLFYINSVTIPFKDDVDKFIKTMDVTTFKEKGGERGISDISDVVKRVLENTNGDTVSMLITDCVFSPGKGKNGTQYLVEQSTGIKNNFSDKLFAENNLMTVVIKMNSQFSGTYYNYLNQPQKLDNKRPYYIWIVGKEKHVNNLLKKIEIEKLNGVQTHHFFYPLSILAQPNYQILRSDKVGNFEFDKKENNTIKSARISDRGTQAGEFGFAIGVDLNKIGIENAYFEDKNNYKLNNSNYNIDIVSITDSMKQIDPALQSYTHKIIVKTHNLQSGDLYIDLKRAIPQWVTNSDSKDDTYQKGAELNKTFGFGSLFNGVSEAYRSTGDEISKNSFFKISINIQK